MIKQRRGAKSVGIRLSVYIELMLFKEYISHVKQSLGFMGKVSHTEVIEMLLKEFLHPNTVADTTDSKSVKYNEWLETQDIEALKSTKIKSVVGTNSKFKSFTLPTDIVTKLTNLCTYLSYGYPYKIDVSYVILILLNRYAYHDYTGIKLPDEFIQKFIEWELSVSS